jgi:hypothetical protein
MEEEKRSNSLPLILGFIIVLGLIAAVAWYLTQSPMSNNNPEAESTPTPTETEFMEEESDTNGLDVMINADVTPPVGDSLPPPLQQQ